MGAKKIIHSLQFRLIAIVLVVFVVSNVILVALALNLSTSSTSKTVSRLLDSVTDKISETGEALHGIAGQMENSIVEIGGQIDKFKV